MSTHSVPTIHIADADLQPWPLPAEWITEGEPHASGRVLAKSDDSCVVRGVWDCTPGQFRWHFTYDETLVVVKGRATVELESAEIVVLNPGDMAFFRRGQLSTWTIHEPFRKAFHADSAEPLPF
jgi:uncharacterized cupin superfamily protein